MEHDETNSFKVYQLCYIERRIVPLMGQIIILCFSFLLFLLQRDNIQLSKKTEGEKEKWKKILLITNIKLMW